jgi:hypothetical protein
MKSAPTSACVILPVLLGGCAMGWTRPNTTEAELQQDRLQCEQQAVSMYPVVMGSSGSGYAQINCTTYGMQVSCTPGVYSPPLQHDVNVGVRANAFDACLHSKGYVSKIEQR